MDIKKMEALFSVGHLSALFLLENSEFGFRRQTEVFPHAIIFFLIFIDPRESMLMALCSRSISNDTSESNPCNLFCFLFPGFNMAFYNT